ncbi:hypothetical protein GCM10010123_41240 [Pilimelia anulata]|uniref:Uncharacterized protein n=1 Tax=Pilimelia anulata TaxID=53371 RepID=A0A8J3BAV0_9ACTN|nr:hypothetical protein [Pilimelia anulata]GGK07171.1 hypothetical protein GCM10010123_41240 [Pilimelia anulata]
MLVSVLLLHPVAARAALPAGIAAADTPAGLAGGCGLFTGTDPAGLPPRGTRAGAPPAHRTQPAADVVLLVVELPATRWGTRGAGAYGTDVPATPVPVRILRC